MRHEERVGRLNGAFLYRALPRFSPRLLFLLQVIAMAACGCGSSGGSGPAEPADTLYLNGNVFTMDHQSSRAQALAIRGEELVFVGDDAGAEVYRGPETVIVDLAGQTVLPGMTDSIGHLAELGRHILAVDLADVSTATEAGERTRKACSLAEPGEWIYGFGWDQTSWQEQQLPTAADLDGCEANPVYLLRIGGHLFWLNDVALQRTGITSATPDPEGGKIFREGQGNPTGLLQDNAMDLVSAVIPKPDNKLRSRQLDVAQNVYLERGFTAIVDGGLDLAEIRALEKFADAGQLKMRVHVLLGDQGNVLNEYLASGPVIGDRGGHLTIRGIKLTADGTLGSRGAALLEPYTDDPRSEGGLITRVEHLEEVCERAHRAGFQVSTHAIGDRAVRTVLDTYEKVLGKGGGDLRWRIEHLQVIDPADLPRIKTLGVIPVCLAPAAIADMAWAEDRLGAERIKNAYPLRSLRDQSDRMPLATLMMQYGAPLAGVQAVVTRQASDGQPAGGWYPEQRLTVAEALAGFTTDAAYANFDEERRGSLQVGKLADFAVLNGDPAAIDPAKLHETVVVKTIIGGAVAYTAD